MSVSSAAPPLGFDRAALDALLDRFGEGSISREARYDALARYQELTPRVSVRGGRSWKQHLDALDFHDVAAFSTDPAEISLESLAPHARRSGVTIEHFSSAKRTHREAFERAFGAAVDTRDDKFASLALAFSHQGVFVHVPDGVLLNEPLQIGYEARDGALCPYTLISLGEGATATVIERIAAEPGAPLVCGITELVLAPRAALTYAVDQRARESRTIVTRRALLGRDARLTLCDAELGGTHAVSRLRIAGAAEGAAMETVALFFTSGEQHVDVESEAVHTAANTTSHTIVRTAGNGRGQGRYLGTIKILANAHGADASLRDDALLLSEGAHIDSVPALEIAANDVKAFHGATVGAISEEEIFYAQSRGIARADAERMIALGFFEPAVARFPTDALRDELRRTLAAKLVPGNVAG